MNKLVLIGLLLAVSYVGISPSKVNAVSLTGGSTYEYDDDDNDWKHGDKHDDKWKHEEKGKDGAPVPFESSPALGALALVGWGMLCWRKNKNKKVVL